MKYLLALVLSVCILCEARACDIHLAGTWQSDKTTSMAFIRDKSKIQANFDGFLDTLLGKMTVTFTGNEVHMLMPDTTVAVAGAMRPFAGSDERKPYKVLFCNAAMIVWSAKQSFATYDVATTYNFVTPDLFWVYGGSTAIGEPDWHIREYFRRVR